MANIRFHNDTASFNHLWYESHKNLITSLCIEYGKTDDIDAMVAKFLCDPVKIKALKDKDKYTKSAQVDKDRYKDEMEQYNA